MHDVWVVSVPPFVRNPAVHAAHVLAPGPLNMLSLPHAVTVKVPSHLYPAAHDTHDVRVFAVGPVVLEPTAHVLHSVEPVSNAYLLSAPQSTHAVPTLFAYVPRAQSCFAFVPSHANPAGHAEHVVRVSFVFPDVNDPAAHVSQLADPFTLLYLLSAPQFEHVLDPPAENLPASHISLSKFPSHLDPAVQAVHPERVVDVPPVVLLPAAQNLHTELPLPGAYWLSYPHTEHECCPALENVPSRQDSFELEPSLQNMPAGHTEQSVRVRPSALPPDVNMPIGHVSQMLAPASEYFLSSPHGTQLPLDTYVPAAHFEGLLEVPHMEPSGQTLQDVRVNSSRNEIPPSVKYPTGQVLQLTALLFSLYFWFAPHSLQSPLWGPLK